jgi:outer membrane autotransporter protein
MATIKPRYRAVWEADWECISISQGLAIEPYAKAEVIEEFLIGNNVRTDNTTFVSSLSGTVGRFGGA